MSLSTKKLFPTMLLSGLLATSAFSQSMKDAEPPVKKVVTTTEKENRPPPLRKEVRQKPKMEKVVKTAAKESGKLPLEVISVKPYRPYEFVDFKVAKKAFKSQSDHRNVVVRMRKASARTQWPQWVWVTARPSTIYFIPKDSGRKYHARVISAKLVGQRKGDGDPQAKQAEAAKKRLPESGARRRAKDEADVVFRVRDERTRNKLLLEKAGNLEIYNDPDFTLDTNAINQ